MRNGILIVYKNQDVSDTLVWNSLTKNEALNNNKNTCWFTLLNQKLSEGEEVVVYDYIINIQPISASDDFMYVNDTYQFEEKYTAGTTIFVDVLWINRKMTIKEVDTTTNKITFTTAFTTDIPVKAIHGSIFFAGSIDRVEENKLSKISDDISYQYSVVAYEKLMDRKVIIDTYIAQYIREIIGRMVYKFMAPDTELVVFDFESALTGSGLCSTTTNYSTEKIVGNYSQKGVATGDGSRSKTISSLDLSTYTHLRYWWKVKALQ